MPNVECLLVRLRLTQVKGQLSDCVCVRWGGERRTWGVFRVRRGGDMGEVLLQVGY